MRVSHERQNQFKILLLRTTNRFNNTTYKKKWVKQLVFELQITYDSDYT